MVKKDKKWKESFVREPLESNPKNKRGRTKAGQIVENIIFLGHALTPKFKKDPPSLEQATKDGKPTKYEASLDDLRRAEKFEEAAKKFGVNTKEGRIAKNRAILIRSTVIEPWTHDIEKGNLKNLKDASNLPTVNQMKIVDKMKKEITKLNKKKK